MPEYPEPASATPPPGLNHRACSLVDAIATRAAELRVEVRRLAGGGRLIDSGARAQGGLVAGLELARVCLAGLADVSLVAGELAGQVQPMIQVVTDHPVAACLASQYAGWAIQVGKFFAMGSGPMRAAAGREELFERIGCKEESDQIVGVLECREPPGDEVFASVANSCRVAPECVTLLFAPTASLAGSVQIVARSVETALHKLAELKFDLARIVSALGTAPLPPLASNDLAAIGRTNDAILYGARVMLYVTGDDDSLRTIGPQVPSCSSRDYGAPFAEIFARYHNDFYAVDPMLFSPAEVVFQNLETGRTHRFGQTSPQVLLRSFA